MGGLVECSLIFEKKDHISAECGGINVCLIQKLTGQVFLCYVLIVRANQRWQNKEAPRLQMTLCWSDLKRTAVAVAIRPKV